MKSSWIVFQWELRRILTNWRKAMTIFVIPSLVLLLILYLFPLLIDFMATGTIGKTTLYLVDPPTSFSDYLETDRGNFSYNFERMEESDFTAKVSDGSARMYAEKGAAFLLFSANQGEADDQSAVSFDDKLTQYYTLSSFNEDAGSLASISILVNPGSIKSTMTADLFVEEELPEYNDFLLRTFGQEYLMAGGGPQFTINEFNPFTSLMIHRSVAHTAAARVLPAAVFLLLYYCIYSIAFDVVGAERERGFLAKIALTPIRKTDIIIGKAAAVSLIGLLNSMTIVVVFIAASWTNFQNSPFSLIPFGFAPFPEQMASIFLLISFAAIVLSLYCFIVIFSCNRPQDVILNLQFPLLLFLASFFINIFRSTASHPLEAFLPIHGTMIMMREILMSNASASQILTVIIIHALTAVILLLVCRKLFTSSYSYNEIEERKQ